MEIERDSETKARVGIGTFCVFLLLFFFAAQLEKLATTTIVLIIIIINQPTCVKSAPMNACSIPIHTVIGMRSCWYGFFS